MKISELLRGQWFEYSGGSKPGTNKIRFVGEDEEEVYLELWYIFDWNTGETEHLSFRLKHSDFDTLAEQLCRNGKGQVESQSEGQRLSFEWKQMPNGFAFRLKGHIVTSLGNPTGIEMADFSEVHCGHLSL